MQYIRFIYNLNISSPFSTKIYFTNAKDINQKSDWECNLDPIKTYGILLRSKQLKTVNLQYIIESKLKHKITVFINISFKLVKDMHFN